MPKNPRSDIVRLGDRVRVVTPKFVIRVGYPKSLKDYHPQIIDARQRLVAYLQELGLYPTGYAALLHNPDYGNEKLFQQIEHNIAHALAKKDGFGGRKRDIHFFEDPQYKDSEHTVTSIRSVTTGTYNPSGGGYTRDGEYDYEPAYLSQTKVHRIATLDLFFFLSIPDETSSVVAEIPTYYLEKVGIASRFRPEEGENANCSY